MSTDFDGSDLCVHCGAKIVVRKDYRDEKLVPPAWGILKVCFSKLNDQAKEGFKKIFKEIWIDVEERYLATLIPSQDLRILQKNECYELILNSNHVSVIKYEIKNTEFDGSIIFDFSELDDVLMDSRLKELREK